MFLDNTILEVSTKAQHGWRVVDSYEVVVTKTAGGEFRSLVHQVPRRSFAVHYVLDRADLWAVLKDIFHRAFGMLGGFRVKCPDDFSTFGHTGTPTPLDEPLVQLSATTFQLVKTYGGTGDALPIGLPRRMIYKPVPGTVRVAVGGVEAASGWTVDTGTGIITFSAAPVGTVTGGCLFHLPVRFDSPLPTTQDMTWGDTGELILIELINRADVI